MKKDIHIIKYKMDMDNGTISKEKFPVIGKETEDDVLNGVSTTYIYDLDGESDIYVDEKLLNRVVRSSTENAVFCICLEDEFESEEYNDKKVVGLFQDVLQTDLQKITKEYLDYVDNYNSKVAIHNDLKEKLSSFIEEKENSNDEIEL